ncbi:hypothetical protein GCM10022223_52440 [Kineosporia mesophila]|uniref:Transposase n=1 Tax=Kineosporia mesophila TaxID=566012 RepID=A0ABP7ABG2_9ACTN|nr:hypothetical protein [Kineosporia mesophila]MCD5351370.1 hypothetical protein [Kineosporia mesophila]
MAERDLSREERALFNPAFTAVAWNRVPTSLFCVLGATCRRRLDEWHAAGVRRRLHEQLLGELRQ